MTSLKKDKILTNKPIDEFLVELIADEFSLYLKTKTAFWNFEYNKPSKHNNLFELQYIEINALIEMIGRRIRDIDSNIFLPRKIDLLTNSKGSVLILKNDAIEHLLKKNQKIIEKLKDRKFIDANCKDISTKELYHNLIVKHESIIERLNSNI
jgi:starvation-inducible DNA-binding protein